MFSLDVDGGGGGGRRVRLVQRPQLGIQNKHLAQVEAPFLHVFVLAVLQTD